MCTGTGQSVVASDFRKNQQNTLLKVRDTLWDAKSECLDVTMEMECKDISLKLKIWIHIVKEQPCQRNRYLK